MKAVVFSALLPALLLGVDPADAQAAPSLTYTEAKAVLDASVKLISGHHLGGAIAVVDDAGNLVAFERLDGAALANGQLATKKAYSAAAFATPTATLQQQLMQGDTSILGNPLAVPLGGGLPLMAGGRLVGAVGVSTPDGNVDGPAAEAGAAAFQR